MNSFEKPFFSNKVGDDEEITLIEEGKVVSEGKEVLETFKSYFRTIVENLGINIKLMSEEPVSNKLAISKPSKYNKNKGKPLRIF